MLFLQYQQRSLSLTKHPRFFSFFGSGYQMDINGCQMLLSCACFRRWCQSDTWSELVPKLLHQWVASLFGVSLPWSPHIFTFFLELVLSDKKTTYNERLIRLVTYWFLLRVYIHAIKTYLQQSFRDATEACPRWIARSATVFGNSPQGPGREMLKSLEFLKLLFFWSCLHVKIHFESLLSFNCSAIKNEKPLPIV